jgi:hypothetical protein
MPAEFDTIVPSGPTSEGSRCFAFPPLTYTLSKYSIA